MKKLLLMLAFCLAAWVPQQVFGQVASAKGMGSVDYSSKLRPEDRKEAQRRAALSAVEAYVAETNVAKAKIFSARRDEFAGKLDQLVLGSTILSESDDKASRRYTVVVRADINAALLRAELDGGSATATARQSQRSLLTFLFMSRQQDTAQAFQDREYRRVDAKAKSRNSGSHTVNTVEGESIGRASIGTSDTVRSNSAMNGNASAVVESGGSTTRRSDKISWKVANSNEINTAMTGVFSGAGYEVVEAEYVEAESRGQLSVARVRKDFSDGNDLTADTMRATANGVRAADIRFLAVGTLDIGMRDTDPVSGNVRVHVTVTGKVLDVSGRFPRTVSSVGPVQFAGLGSDESVARTNALTLASEKAAQTMVDELNARSVK